MKKYKGQWLTLFVCLIVIGGHTQQSDTLEILRNKDGIIRYLKLSPNTHLNLKQADDFVKSVLKSSSDFKLTKTTVDKDGTEHRRYDQYFDGVKVWGAEYLVHGKSGKIEIINGNYKNIEAISTKPDISDSSAIRKSLSFVGAKIYKWEDQKLEALLRKIKTNEKASYYPHPELYVVKGFSAKTKTAKLAWILTISTLSPENEIQVLIDAHTGEILGSKSLLMHSNTTLTAETRYNGTINITGDSYGGGYRLYESRNSSTIQTLDILGGSNYASAVDINNSSTSFTNGSWTSFSTNREALDAHKAGELVSDYWNSVFSRSNIDGSGGAMTAYTRFNNGIAGFPNNAQWDPTGQVVRLGNGDNSLFYPLTAVDVVAHEWGHGITQFTCNISFGSSGNDQADAINEGLSDIWGASIENWGTSGKSTWLIGEEIMANGKNSLRNMSNPKDGSSQTQGPTTIGRTNWTGSNAHIDCMIMDYWFYLLSQGGSGGNDMSPVQYYNVYGIGISEAAQIVYKAETTYLSPGDDYSACRTAMILAAQNLYGVGSCEDRSVTNAWHAVGVGNRYFDGTSYISGTKYICVGNSQTYTIYNLPSGMGVTWSVSNPTIASLSASGNSVTVTASGNGIVNITASPSSACGDIIPNGSIDIALGSAALGYYDVSSSYYSSSNNTLAYGGGSVMTRNNQSVMFNIQLDASLYSSVSWSVGGTYNLFYPYSSSALLYMTTPSTAYTSRNATVYLSATGPCGSISTSYNFQVVANGMSFRMAASPNPASGNINVTIQKITDSSELAKQPVQEMARSSNSAGITRLSLYDFNSNALVKEWKYDEIELMNFHLNIAGIKKGIYVLKMERDNNTTSTKVIVQ